MKARVQKWGNSLVLRIPKSLAAAVGLRAGTPVELSLAGGKLVIRPSGDEPLTLEEVLRGLPRCSRSGRKWEARRQENGKADADHRAELD